MEKQKLRNRKLYKTSGLVIMLVGVATSVYGFYTYQVASADVSVVQRSDLGLILIIAGAVMAVGAIITFIYLVTADFS